MARIIGEVRPRYAFVENSPMLTSRGLGTVLGDLAAMGFDARWGVISAADVGAPHLRERIWIVGHANVHGIPASNEKQVIQRKPNRTQENIQQSARSNISEIFDSNSHSESISTVNAETICKPDMAHSNSTQRQGNKCAKQEQPAHANIGSAGWWASEPDVGRVANGVDARVDRLKAIGNGQVPLCAATAFRLLSDGL
jgi:DNA (cytosine-5)-methyltransferase 1